MFVDVDVCTCKPSGQIKNTRVFIIYHTHKIYFQKFESTNSFWRHLPIKRPVSISPLRLKFVTSYHSYWSKDRQTRSHTSHTQHNKIPIRALQYEYSICPADSQQAKKDSRTKRHGSTHNQRIIFIIIIAYRPHKTQEVVSFWLTLAWLLYHLRSYSSFLSNSW